MHVTTQQRQRRWKMDQAYLSQFFPGAGPDPYEHCMISIFALSFYYRADVALVASRYYDIGIRIWPELSYISERAKKYMIVAGTGSGGAAAIGKKKDESQVPETMKRALSMSTPGYSSSSTKDEDEGDNNNYLSTIPPSLPLSSSILPSLPLSSSNPPGDTQQHADLSSLPQCTARLANPPPSPPSLSCPPSFSARPPPVLRVLGVERIVLDLRRFVLLHRHFLLLLG